MCDKTHIGFIDSHAKRNRGDDDYTLLDQESLLVLCPCNGVQAGVVGQCGTAFLAQPVGYRFNSFARQAIDNTRIRGMVGLDKSPESLTIILAFADAIENIGAIKTMDENPGILQSQLFDNLFACALVCRGRQSDARYLRELFVQ